MDLRAIETVYNGYRFRSRLEARWAVFLDALKIPYDYEREGFDLGGTWYLPDFLLLRPRPRVWLEIKPELPESDDERKALLKKMYELSRRSKQHVVVVFGKPFPGEYKIMFAGYLSESDELVIPLLGRHPSQRVLFAESDCGAIHVVHFDAEEGRLISTIHLRDSLRDCPNLGACQMTMFDDRPDMNAMSPDLWNAMLKARQERFERVKSPLC